MAADGLDTDHYIMLESKPARVGWANKEEFWLQTGVFQRDENDEPVFESDAPPVVLSAEQADTLATAIAEGPEDG